MGGPAPEYRTGKAQFDGALPIVINSPVMVMTDAGVTLQGSFTAPCDGEIVAIIGNLVAQPSASPCVLKAGIRGNATKFINDFSIPGTQALGKFEIPVTHASIASRNITKGEIVEFATDGAATATGGNVAISLVIMPRAG